MVDDEVMQVEQDYLYLRGGDGGRYFVCQSSTLPGKNKKVHYGKEMK